MEKILENVKLERIMPDKNRQAIFDSLEFLHKNLRFQTMSDEIRI